MDLKLVLTERFEAALALAARLHARQRRKGSDVPYISHLLAVTSLVLEYGGSEDQAIGALLHDAVEDQGGAPRLEEIRHRFGDAVAAIVDGCTDADTVPKPPWSDRKQAFLERLANASADVRLVVAADKLHNARCILRDYRQVGDTVWDRFTADRRQTLWYHRRVTEVLRAAGSHPLVDELHDVVGELEQTITASE